MTVRPETFPSESANMPRTSRRQSTDITPHFRLMDLPTEIREAILEYALVSDKPLVSFRLDNYQRESYTEAIPPPLTQVSRQIRRECLPAFYQVNDFILHTEDPRLYETGKWLKSHEDILPNILNLSLWVRYVTLTNDRHASNGAICLSLTRARRDGVWHVPDRWRWLTVTRKPGAVESDAKFLIAELGRIVQEEPGCLDSARGVVGVLTDLKMLYVQEKMS